ncbi:MAG: hypothetical protein AAF571_11870 [Verrucomicrobiota bacterium]
MMNAFLAIARNKPSFLWVVALCLSTLPLWLTTYPPIVDLAQHTSQVATLKEWLSGAPYYREQFEVNWFTPYLTGYLFTLLIGYFVPILVAVKLVLSLAMVGIPWSVGVLLRELGGDPRLKWLAIPASYCYAFYYGFYSYLIAVPLGLLFITLAIRWNQKTNKQTAVFIVAASFILFFSHLVVLGFCSLISLTYLAACNYRRPLRLIRCALPYTAPIPLIVYWMVQAQLQEPTLQGERVVFAPFRERVVHLVTQVAGMDGYAYIVSLLMFTCIVAVPYCAGFRITSRPERYGLFVVGLLVFFCFPAFAQNTAFLYQRLGVFLVPLWVIIWDPPQELKRGFWLAVAAALACWWGANLYRFAVFERDTQSFRYVLAEMEPEYRTGGLMIDNTHRLFSHPVLLHFPVWYQANSEGISDMSFAMTHPSIMRYPERDGAYIDTDVLWYPHQLDQQKHQTVQYRYFLLYSLTRQPDDLFDQLGFQVELVINEGNWFLYQTMPNRNR